jgi:hypothetical protein
MIRDALSRLVRAWHGLASILLGPAAFEGERGRDLHVLVLHHGACLDQLVDMNQRSEGDAAFIGDARIDVGGIHFEAARSRASGGMAQHGRYQARMKNTGASSRPAASAVASYSV